MFRELTPRYYVLSFMFIAVVVILILLLVPIKPLFAEEVGQTHKILILYSQNTNYPAHGAFTKGFMAEFQQRNASKVEYSYENLEMAKYSSNKTYTENVSRFLKEKYAADPPDLIVTYLEPAADFMIDNGKAIFPGIPVVFGLDENEGIPTKNLPPQYSGIIGSYDVMANINLIIQSKPDTKKIYVVIDDSENGNKTILDFKNKVATLTGDVEFIYLNKQPFSMMLESVKEIKDNSVILYFYIFKDIDGKTFIPIEALQQLSQVAKVPIYSVVSTYIGRGTADCVKTNLIFKYKSSLF